MADDLKRALEHQMHANAALAGREDHFARLVAHRLTAKAAHELHVLRGEYREDLVAAALHRAWEGHGGHGTHPRLRVALRQDDGVGQLRRVVTKRRADPGASEHWRSGRLDHA